VIATIVADDQLAIGAILLATIAPLGDLTFRFEVQFRRV
jgi:hypothetical protein